MAEHVCEACIRRARHRSMLLLQLALVIAKLGVVVAPVVIRLLS